MSRRTAYLVVAAAAALPRLGVVLAERGDILEAFTEKNDDFARTLVEHGTFGFVPGEPSAYTQPLYGWFLAALYWVFERHWAVVGLAQVAVAVATALVVYELGRRFVTQRAGIVAALVATLNPYLVWHDVHVNRELLDGFVAAGLVLALLAAAGRRSVALAALTGAIAGLAILGNARLLLVPLLVAGFLLWRRSPAISAAAVLVAAAVVLSPWVVRNEVEVGCFALTTDSRALWKANNEKTLEILRGGRWIDDVPRLPGTPFTPEEAATIYRDTGRVVEVDECEQMRFYRELVFDFWEEHPGEKARLAARAATMLWDPRVTQTESGAGSGGWQDVARRWLAPVYFVPLYVLAVLGIGRLRREVLVLVLALLAYTTLAALVFVGATRYRAPWDFLLALPAAAALVELGRRR